MSYRGKGSTTSHLRSHPDICMLKQVHKAKEANQPFIQFKPSNIANPFTTPSVRYYNEKNKGNNCHFNYGS